MSIYAVNKLCFQVERNPAFREQVRRNPASTLADLKLTPTERQALLEGDVVALYLLGAHPFLLQHLGRYGIFGLDLPTYRQRIQTLADQPDPAT